MTSTIVGDGEPMAVAACDTFADELAPVQPIRRHDVNFVEAGANHRLLASQMTLRLGLSFGVPMEEKRELLASRKPAPFNDRKDKPYLETHHIVWLAPDGADMIENAVALCLTRIYATAQAPPLRTPLRQ